MKYRVEIDFTKGPSFSGTVEANCSEVARAYAKDDAKRCGFNGKVKKITVRVEQ